MLRSFDNYNKLLEKQDNREKLKKFINIPDLIEYIYELEPKFTVWVGNVYKDQIIKYVKDNNISININKVLQEGTKTKEEKEKLDEIISIVEREIKDDLKTVLDWFNSPLRREKIKLGNLDFNTAVEKAKNFHDDLKSSGKAIENETGEIVMRFNDGFYWIDLEASSDKQEGESMGHCASTLADTLISLRDPNKRPHVTMAFTGEGLIYQLKGKENTKPKEKYHKYIVEFLKIPNVDTDFVVDTVDEEDFDYYHVKNFQYEYDAEHDFNIFDLSEDKIIEVLNINPDLDTGFGIRYLKYKNNMVGGDDIVKLWDDLYFENGDFKLKINEWEDLSDLFKYFRDRKDGVEIQILNGEFFDLIDIESDPAIFFNTWDRRLNKTKKQIMNDVINSDEEFYIGDDEGYINITKDMIYFDEEKGEVYVEYNDENYLLVDILEQSKETKIYEKIRWTYHQCNILNTEREALDDVYKSIEETLGPVSFEKEGTFITINKILSDISKTESYSEETAEDHHSMLEYINFLHEEYDLLDDGIEVEEPRYGWGERYDIDEEEFYQMYTEEADDIIG